MKTPASLYRNPGFWLLPVIAGVFLIASLAVLLTLHNRLQAVSDAVRDDALWAAYQLDRENLRFNSLLSQYLYQPEAISDQEVELRFEILYSRLNILRQGQFARVFGEEAQTRNKTQTLIRLIEEMDSVFATDQAFTPQGSEKLLQLSEQLQAVSARLSSSMKGYSTRITTEARQSKLELYRYLAGLVLLLSLSMGLMIVLLIHKMRESWQAQLQAQEMATQLEITASRAEEASRAKSDFLATMSHEIRTPMNGVLGMTDLLRETPLSAEQQTYADAAFKSAHSLLTLLNDLLDISRLEAGRLVLDYQKTYLKPLIEEVAGFFSAELKQKQLDFYWNLHPQAEGCYNTDAGRLRQILFNLIGNALKFTEKGYIRLDVEPRGGEIQFTVSDTGMGIAEEAQSRLFEVFTQADASISRRYGGTGLGLTICQRIVEQLGGEIGFHSTPGQGSCFYFTLPLEEATTDQGASD
ncbi:ATP-binding protein [Marinospirillum perlucidum]|uniref:ATP-binding protein n=1 Tax=Marinospirillum perlucidum TaxID=1982602 RepID=UPI000DF12D46|nr:ATP-binding protein [Marinospirillum perlucidum]